LPQAPALPSVPTLEELVTNSGMSLSEVLHSPEAVHAAMKVSDLSLLGLEHGYLNIAGWVRDALVAGHTLTGLPWYVPLPPNTKRRLYSGGALSLLSPSPSVFASSPSLSA
jgi:YidC/Oxa1 family membrane protein insertase